MIDVNLNVTIKYRANSEEPLHMKRWWARNQVKAALERAGERGEISHEHCAVESVAVELSNNVFTADFFRNQKQNLFAERKSMQEVHDYVDTLTTAGPERVAMITAVGVAINTVLELLAKAAEEEPVDANA